MSEGLGIFVGDDFGEIGMGCTEHYSGIYNEPSQWPSMVSSRPKPADNRTETWFGNNTKG